MDRSKALSLLASNVPQHIVASTLGVSDSLISQLMADDDFLLELSNLKFEKLEKETQRDLKYDLMEDTLLKQLEDFVGVMTDPVKIAKVLQIINGAKRRGAAGASLDSSSAGTIVTLVLPKTTAATFVFNVGNQIISDGERELRTIQTSEFASTVQAAKEKELCLPQLNDL